MARFEQIDPASTSGNVKELLEQVNGALGVIPNMAKVMANSPAVLQAYVDLYTALAGGRLDPRLRLALALVSAQDNECRYCLSAHTAIGKHMGMSDAEIVSARRAGADDMKSDTALKFADNVIRERGHVSAADVQELRNAGFQDGEILEVVGAVVLNTFINYVNLVAETDIDFPLVRAA